MEYVKKVIIPSSEETVTHYVASCVICNSDDININEYEDQFGFISTVSCKVCKNEVKGKEAEIAVIQKWNQKNDIPTLISSKNKLLEKTKSEIKQLKLLQRERNKKK